MKTAAMKGFEVMRMIRRGHRLTCKPQVKDEVRFVNKLFDIFVIDAWCNPRNGRTATNRGNATEPDMLSNKLENVHSRVRNKFPLMFL
jgi:hypothetical protein